VRTGNCIGLFSEYTGLFSVKCVYVLISEHRLVHWALFRDTYAHIDRRAHATVWGFFQAIRGFSHKIKGSFMDVHLLDFGSKCVLIGEHKAALCIGRYDMEGSLDVFVY